MARLEDRAPADARTITVRVTFFADLRRFLPRGADGPQPYTVPAGSTMADLLKVIGIDRDRDLTLALNGELADAATPLPDGADVMLLTPMEGGAAAEGEATRSIDGPVRLLPGPTAGEPQPNARRPFP